MATRSRQRQPGQYRRQQERVRQQRDAAQGRLRPQRLPEQYQRRQCQRHDPDRAEPAMGAGTQQRRERAQARQTGLFVGFGQQRRQRGKPEHQYQPGTDTGTAQQHRTQPATFQQALGRPVQPGRQRQDQRQCQPRAAVQRPQPACQQRLRARTGGGRHQVQRERRQQHESKARMPRRQRQQRHGDRREEGHDAPQQARGIRWIRRQRRHRVHSGSNGEGGSCR